MHKTVNSKQDNLEVLEEQTSQLYTSVNKAIFATVINSIILVAVLWPAVEQAFLLSWLFSIIFISLLRGIIAYRYKTEFTSLNEIHVWLKRFLAGSISASVLWGAASFWIFPADDLARQVFLAFVIGGMAAAAITTLSYVKIAAYAFLVLSLLPLMLQFL